MKLDPAKCMVAGCKIDPQKMERRKVLLREEGPARVWLVINGPHALAFQLEVNALNELGAKMGEGHA